MTGAVPAYVVADRLSRAFDVSRPRLRRLLAGEGRRALLAAREVSFSIPPGRTYALVGESGSGKTTVARMVVGLLRPSSGSVRIGGVSVTDPREARALRRMRRSIQMVFQDPYASLDPRWRAERLVAEPIHAFGLARPGPEARERVAELLRRVGLDPRDGRKYPHEFSGGQRQRVSIARALASGPRFLACDEPTSALDVSVQAQILNLLKDVQAELGLACLLISHDLAVVRHMADRVGVLYLGRLVEEAPAAELFARPRHPYTRLLLDAVPDLAAVGRPRRPVPGEAPSPLDPPPGCPFHPRCPFANARCRAEPPGPTADGPSLAACHAVEEGRLPRAA